LLSFVLVNRTSFRLFLLGLLVATTAQARPLPTEYVSDQFVVLAEDIDGSPLIATLDFNRGTSQVPGRERVSEFVGHFCYRGEWRDLQSGEYPAVGGHPHRLIGNGVARPRKDRKGRWTLDYDGHRATFQVTTKEEILLHVQRDDPEMTIRHSGMEARFEMGGKAYPATVFREHVRWRGYNRLIGKTPSRMYGSFDWMPLVSRRGDWWLLIQDPGQARVPEDAPDHNWGVYRSPQGVVRPLAGDEFRLYPMHATPKPPRHQRRRRSRPVANGYRYRPTQETTTRRSFGPLPHSGAPLGWSVHLPSLKTRGEVFDRGHMLDRFRSGLYAVRGQFYIPGEGPRVVYGLVDHIEK
jgi:hypothetical protein